MGADDEHDYAKGDVMTAVTSTPGSRGARRRLATVAVSAAALTAVAACGSTVQNRGTSGNAFGASGDAGTGLGEAAVPGAPDGDGLGGPGLVLDESGQGELGTAAGPGTVPGSVPGTVPGVAGSGAGPDGSGQTPGSAPQQGGGSSPLNHGPGVTAKTISVGFAYDPGADKYRESLGGGAGAQGNTRRVVEAITADINRRGGIAGRTLKMVYHEIDSASGQTNAQRAQAACEAYTTDAKVFAAADATNEDFRACSRKAGFINVVGGGLVAGVTALDEVEFRANPQFYDVQGLLLDRVGAALVDELVSQRYFVKWDNASGQPGGALPVKPGIIVPDIPGWQRVIKNVVLPRLKAAGFPVDSDNVHTWPFPDSRSEDAQAVAGVQSAVLKFRNNGVTHVLPMEVNSLGFFAQPAESQGYRPRYGLSSAVKAQSYAGSLIPYRQLNGAMGLGWAPAIDLPESAVKEGGPYAGPGRAACLDVMKRAGIGFSSGSERAKALTLCDEFYSLDSTIEAIPAGSPINIATFMQALEGPTGFRIAALPTGTFGPGRRYPVTHGYHYSYSPACTCMQYSGSRFALG
jgi:hypothetical protein